LQPSTTVSIISSSWNWPALLSTNPQADARSACGWICSGSRVQSGLARRCCCVSSSSRDVAVAAARPRGSRRGRPHGRPRRQPD
jgi:hypothetical protein